MKLVVVVVAILAAIGAAASTGPTDQPAPPPVTSPLPPVSLDLRCGFGHYDDNVRAVIRVAPPSTDPHC